MARCAGEWVCRQGMCAGRGRGSPADAAGGPALEPTPAAPPAQPLSALLMLLGQVDFTLVCAIRLYRQQASYCFGVCSEDGKVWLGNAAKLLKGHDFLVHI